MSTQAIVGLIFGGVAFACFACIIFANWLLKNLDHYDGEHW